MFLGTPSIASHPLRCVHCLRRVSGHTSTAATRHGRPNVPGTSAPAKTCASLLRHSVARFEVLSWWFHCFGRCHFPAWKSNFTTSQLRCRIMHPRFSADRNPRSPAANDRLRQGQAEQTGPNDERSGSTRKPIKSALLPPIVHAPPVTVLWIPTLTPPLLPGTPTPGLVTRPLPVTPSPFAELHFNRHPQCCNAI